MKNPTHILYSNVCEMLALSAFRCQNGSQYDLVSRTTLGEAEISSSFKETSCLGVKF